MECIIDGNWRFTETNSLQRLKNVPEKARFCLHVVLIVNKQKKFRRVMLSEFRNVKFLYQTIGSKFDLETFENVSICGSRRYVHYCIDGQVTSCPEKDGSRKNVCQRLMRTNLATIIQSSELTNLVPINLTFQIPNGRFL